MKTISLHGSYFQNNFGDILLMAIITNWLKEAGYSVNLPVSFESMRKLIGADTIGYSNYLQSEALVFGGGGYFGEPNTKKAIWTYRNYLRHIFPYSNGIIGSKKPYIIIGVGVGPISNNFLRKRVVNLFENAVFASVRDNESFDFLKKYGLKRDDLVINPDIALTLNKVNPFVSPKVKVEDDSKIRIGYHLSYSADHKFTKFFLAYFKKLLEKDDRIELVCIVDSTSRNKLLDSIEPEISGWKNASIARYSDPDQIITLLNSFDRVVTHKLHVGIVSLSLNKPVLSFPLHQKTQRLYRQLGIENQCMPLGNFKEDEFTRFLDTNLLTATTGKISEISEQALKNKAILLEFLKRR
jgi:polysaccharide pyruvyl transferase WcaK-like protein